MLAAMVLLGAYGLVGRREAMSSYPGPYARYERYPFTVLLIVATSRIMKIFVASLVVCIPFFAVLWFAEYFNTGRIGALWEDFTWEGVQFYVVFFTLAAPVIIRSFAQRAIDSLQNFALRLGARGRKAYLIFSRPYIWSLGQLVFYHPSNLWAGGVRGVSTWKFLGMLLGLSVYLTFLVIYLALIGIAFTLPVTFSYYLTSPDYGSAGVESGVFLLTVGFSALISSEFLGFLNDKWTKRWRLGLVLIALQVGLIAGLDRVSGESSWLQRSDMSQVASWGIPPVAVTGAVIGVLIGSMYALAQVALALLLALSEPAVLPAMRKDKDLLMWANSLGEASGIIVIQFGHDPWRELWAFFLPRTSGDLLELVESVNSTLARQADVKSGIGITMSRKYRGGRAFADPKDDVRAWDVVIVQPEREQEPSLYSEVRATIAARVPQTYRGRRWSNVKVGKYLEPVLDTDFVVEKKRGPGIRFWRKSLSVKCEAEGLVRGSLDSPDGVMTARLVREDGAQAPPGAQRGGAAP